MCTHTQAHHMRACMHVIYIMEAPLPVTARRRSRCSHGVIHLFEQPYYSSCSFVLDKGSTHLRSLNLNLFHAHCTAQEILIESAWMALLEGAHASFLLFATIKGALESHGPRPPADKPGAASALDSALQISTWISILVNHASNDYPQFQSAKI